jgi:hypothetical protein
VLLHCPDWEGVGQLGVAGGAGVAAQAVGPGQWLVSGLRRGQAVGLWPAAGAAAAPDFVVREAVGRNASEYNWWGSTFVYAGELP